MSKKHPRKEQRRKGRARWAPTDPRTVAAIEREADRPERAINPDEQARVQREARSLTLIARMDPGVRDFLRREALTIREFEPVVQVISDLTLVDFDEGARGRTTISETGELPESKNLVYVEVINAGQRDCDMHVLGGGDRFGFGECVRCLAVMWTPMFVADGVYGEHTLEWALVREAGYAKRVTGSLRLA